MNEVLNLSGMINVCDIKTTLQSEAAELAVVYSVAAEHFVEPEEAGLVEAAAVVTEPEPAAAKEQMPEGVPVVLVLYLSRAETEDTGWVEDETEAVLA